MDWHVKSRYDYASQSYFRFRRHMTSIKRWTRILTDVTNALLTFTNPQKLITGRFLRTSAKKFLIWNIELLAWVEVLKTCDYEEYKVNLAIWAFVIRVFVYPLFLFHGRDEHQSAAKIEVGAHVRWVARAVSVSRPTMLVPSSHFLFLLRQA